MTTAEATLEASSFQKRPAYRYIRAIDKLPRIDELGEDPIARVKLFDPTGSWTWYIAGYDPGARLMAGTPAYKVYDDAGVYQASCKDPMLAAAVVALLGAGATIRHGGHGPRDIVWREGNEEIPASESYDVTADTINARVAARRAVPA